MSLHVCFKSASVNVVEQISFALSGIGAFGLIIFFIHLFLLNRSYYNFSKILSASSFAGASALNFINQGFTSTTIGLFAVAHILIFVGVVFDKHAISFFRYLLLFPIIASLFLEGHQLILVLTIFTTIGVIPLAYTRTHARAIPAVGIMFLLIAAEYFYSRIGTGEFEFSPQTGPFMYVFALLILLIWLLFFLLRKSYRIMWE